MTHLTDVIEEEKEKIFTKYDFGYMNGSTFGVIEDLTNDLDQAMHKAALAVLDELEWKGKGFHSGSEVVAWSDNKREEIRTKLLDNK